ncbi:hypothetical protein THIOSC15_490007 [uncultured Thiomicrorhabdus sp.]
MTEEERKEANANNTTETNETSEMGETGNQDEQPTDQSTEQPEPKQPDETQAQYEQRIEKLAQQIGWNPGYDGGDKLTAEEYILKSREIQNTASDHIKRQNRSIQELKNNFQAYKQHMDALYAAQKIQMNKDLMDLNTQRKEAVEENDNDRVQAIDAQINDMRKMPQNLPTPETNIHPDFVSWVEHNAWYEDDNDLRTYADFLGDQPEFRAEAKRDYRNMLTKVEDAVKRMFPDKFKPKTTARTPAPASTSTSTQPDTKTAADLPPRAAAVEPNNPKPPVKRSKYTYSDLSRDQQNLADFYEKQGIMSKEEYIKQLQEIEEARSV